MTLPGTAGDYPPTDEAGFHAFARSCGEGRIYEALAGAEPLGPIHGYQRTENVLRHYERLPRWPASSPSATRSAPSTRSMDRG